MSKTSIAQLARDRAAARRRSGLEAVRVRPKGRSLREFRPLFPLEEKLLIASASGERASSSGGLPRGKRKSNRVRAKFLRFLILGGDDEAPVHETGIQLRGAFIEGVLDLSGCAVAGSIMLIECQIEDGLRCTDTGVTNLILWGSSVARLEADRLRCSGEMLLGRGFTAKSGVRLRRASIAGDLFCGGGVFDSEDDIAILLDEARVGGSVWFTDKFRARSQVRMNGAQIGGDLVIHQASFGPFSTSPFEPFALLAREIEIRGALVLRNVETSGGMSFADARAAILSDDVASWRGPLDFHGFEYDRLEGETDARMRIRWLRFQPDFDQFDRQPWEHLYRVLRRMGHGKQASLVSIAKHRELRRRGLIGQRTVVGVRQLTRRRNLVLNSLERMAHWSYGLVAGYGHRKVRAALVAALAFWLVASAAYSIGRSYFGPTDSGLVARRDQLACGYRGERGRTPWVACRGVPPEYPTFQPIMYSADLILPFLDLQQEKAWAPIVVDVEGRRMAAGSGLRVLMWLEMLFGWGVVGYLVSLIGKLAGTDPEG